MYALDEPNNDVHELHSAVATSSLHDKGTKSFTALTTNTSETHSDNRRKDFIMLDFCSNYNVFLQATIHTVRAGTITSICVVLFPIFAVIDTYMVSFIFRPIDAVQDQYSFKPIFH